MILLFLGDVFCFVPVFDAAIRHNDVRPTEVLSCLLEQSFDLRNFGNVGPDTNGTRPIFERFDNRANLIDGGLAVRVVHDHRGYMLAELHTVPASNASPGTSDQDDFAI